MEMVLYEKGYILLIELGNVFCILFLYYCSNLF
jgi:hypothetical protein